MLNVDLAACKSGKKIDFGVVEEVVALALEAGVGLLLNLEDNIAGLNTRQLIAFAAEFDLVAALDTAVDVDVQDLALDNSLLSVALLAPVLVANDFALSLAVRAHSLKALNHGTHLPHHVLHTATITASALLNSALLAANTVALGTNDGLLESELRDLAAVDVLERDLVGMGDGARLLGTLLAHTATKHASEGATTTAAATEELREQVLSSHMATAAALLEAFLTILIVNLTFLRVLENLICVREILELVCGVGVVCVLVRVPLQRTLLIC